jgi:hypothetical protein
MRIDRLIDELDESYIRRKWFIEQIAPKTEEESREAVRLSERWVYMLFLGCIYPKIVVDKIRNILRNTKYAIENK